MVEVIDPVKGLDQSGHAGGFQHRRHPHQPRQIARQLRFAAHAFDQGVAGNGKLGAAQGPRIGDHGFGGFEQVRQLGRVGEVGPGRRELGDAEAVGITQGPQGGSLGAIAPVHRPEFDELEIVLFCECEALLERHLLEPGIQVRGII